MWISYSDSEVNRFHPVCEKALKYALVRMGKEAVYQVIHHQYTGALEMDYCVQNRNTGKYLCVVEVKRTPADVHSSRYQFQAMSYVQMNSGNNEKPFYILTNLEYAFAFRYDARRPRAFQQMLKPGLSLIGSFEDSDEEEFTRKLGEYFAAMLSDFCADRYDYLVTLEEFASHMEQLKKDPRRWKSHLAVFLYEYIRGAFAGINRNDLKDIRLFGDDVKKICNEAARVNFKDIFSYSPMMFEEKAHIDPGILADIYDFGNQNRSGDSISGLLHQIISAGHEHEGEVPTDLELGRIVAELAKHISGDLKRDELLCDPAAGSGNLVSSAIDTFGLSPDQILVNDVNPRLLELLSLRLGLNFATIICSKNSPVIEHKDIADLDRIFFERVGVIMMNPPFVAGINCVGRKQPLFRRIKELTGMDAVTDVGQMPLEGVFLELVTHLVVPGTTIACIIPKTHLMARGAEAQVIRSLVLNNLGLRTVFNYPGDEIFDDVTKDTCVLVGKAMEPGTWVHVISSYEKIPDLDTHRFAQALGAELSDIFSPIMPGVVARKISTEELERKTEDGWRELNGELSEAADFVRSYFETYPAMKLLSDYDYPIKRGTAANSGGSDLMFFDSREELYDTFSNDHVVLEPAMRNAKLDRFEIGGGDAKFLNVESNDAALVDRILDAYLLLPERDGKQKRQTKSKSGWLKILRKESRGRFPGNSVLIPRNIRRKGRIYLSEKPVFVSTNFVVCSLPDDGKAVMVSTWMSTIFYQLICEVSSKDQEGARKMEVKDILKTLVPDLDTRSAGLLPLLQAEKNHTEFLDLQDPVIREVDRIWAAELFGAEGEDILEEARRLLEFLANKRN